MESINQIDRCCLPYKRRIRERFEGASELRSHITSIVSLSKVCLIRFSVRNTIIDARTVDKRDRRAIRIVKVAKLLRQNISAHRAYFGKARSLFFSPLLLWDRKSKRILSQRMLSFFLFALPSHRIPARDTASCALDESRISTEIFQSFAATFCRLQSPII